MAFEKFSQGDDLRLEIVPARGAWIRPLGQDVHREEYEWLLDANAHYEVVGRKYIEYCSRQIEVLQVRELLPDPAVIVRLAREEAERAAREAAQKAAEAARAFQPVTFANRAMQESASPVGLIGYTLSMAETPPKTPRDEYPIDPEDPDVIADRMARWNTPAEEIVIISRADGSAPPPRPPRPPRPQDLP